VILESLLVDRVVNRVSEFWWSLAVAEQRSNATSSHHQLTGQAYVCTMYVHTSPHTQPSACHCIKSKYMVTKFALYTPDFM
jgi:hypothetical protein